MYNVLTKVISFPVFPVAMINALYQNHTLMDKHALIVLKHLIQKQEHVNHAKKDLISIKIKEYAYKKIVMFTH